MVDAAGDSASVALLTEQRVFGPVVPLTRAAPVGTGKALLARSTAEVTPTLPRLTLSLVVTELDWSAYTEQRIHVEAEFGIDSSDAQALVRDRRDRLGHLGLDLYTAQESDQVVGAIARFRLPAPHRHVACLQEIDISPPAEAAATVTPCCRRCSNSWRERASRWWSSEPTRAIGR